MWKTFSEPILPETGLVFTPSHYFSQSVSIDALYLEPMTAPFFQVHLVRHNREPLHLPGHWFTQLPDGRIFIETWHCLIGQQHVIHINNLDCYPHSPQAVLTYHLL